jgi:hypothetical protein
MNEKVPDSVIASQRVGAKRRPMTGSAKQSILLSFRGKMDCFVASLLAMTSITTEVERHGSRRTSRPFVEARNRRSKA